MTISNCLHSNYFNILLYNEANRGVKYWDALSTTSISVSVFNAVTGEYSFVQFTSSIMGAIFAPTMTAPLGRENSRYWGNLYHHNEKRSPCPLLHLLGWFRCPATGVHPPYV